MALTKAEMAERLFEDLGLNKREAKELVEAFFEEVRASLEAGQQVKLSGFGNFDLRDKNQRPGRNIRARDKASRRCSYGGRGFSGGRLSLSPPLPAGA